MMATQQISIRPRKTYLIVLPRMVLQAKSVVRIN
jgi:hypothetical protein